MLNAVTLSFAQDAVIGMLVVVFLGAIVLIGPADRYYRRKAGEAGRDVQPPPQV